MEELGKRIRKLREIKRLSQSEIEKRTGLKREYLSKIENCDLRNPTYTTLQKLAKGLEVRISELVDPEEFLKPREAPVIKLVSNNIRREQSLVDQVDKGEYVSVPILDSKMAAGNPVHIDESDIQDYALIHSTCLEPTTDYNRYRCVWIKAGSESMHPFIRSRSLVCVDSSQQDPQALAGSVVVLRDEDGDCTVRHLKICKNFIVGVPENIAEYDPLVLQQSKNSPVVGKVVWFWTNLNEKL